MFGTLIRHGRPTISQHVLTAALVRSSCVVYVGRGLCVLNLHCRVILQHERYGAKLWACDLALCVCSKVLEL